MRNPNARLHKRQLVPLHCCNTTNTIPNMTRITTLLLSSLVVLGASAGSAVIDLIPGNFEDVVLKSGKPALVEFFAPWCGRKLQCTLS
jgi:hypothetical protein